MGENKCSKEYKQYTETEYFSPTLLAWKTFSNTIYDLKINELENQTMHIEDNIAGKKWMKELYY